MSKLTHLHSDGNVTLHSHITNDEPRIIDSLAEAYLNRLENIHLTGTPNDEVLAVIRRLSNPTAIGYISRHSFSLAVNFLSKRTFSLASLVDDNDRRWFTPEQRRSPVPMPPIPATASFTGDISPLFDFKTDSHLPPEHTIY